MTYDNKPLYLSTQVWKRAQQRAAADLISINAAYTWLLRAYAQGHLDVPCADTLRGIPRNTCTLRPEPTALAAAEARAAAAGLKFPALMEVLLDQYGRGDIAFTPLMHRRSDNATPAA